MRRRLLCLAPLAVLAASLAVTSPAAAGQRIVLPVGATFTITGHTGSAPGKHVRATGTVVLSGRWGLGKWHVITTTATDGSGNYRFTFTPRRRGNITLHIAPPDRHSRWYRLRVY